MLWPDVHVWTRVENLLTIKSYSLSLPASDSRLSTITPSSHHVLSPSYPILLSLSFHIHTLNLRARDVLKYAKEDGKNLLEY